MVILSIDTSCDETSVAITEGRRVLANVVYSQILIHEKWGGVVPSLAKRAHEEKIDLVVEKCLKKFEKYLHEDMTLFAHRHPLIREPSVIGSKYISSLHCPFSIIDCIAVTYGPGLAIALEVGIKKAKELVEKYNKKLIAVSHMEGHIYSAFVQNSQGHPVREFEFPYLVLLISGGHTELVLFKNHLSYEILGHTIDDAAGEALDKAAKLLGLGYPGGAVIEKLAEKAGNKDYYNFPRPMMKSKDLNFSFSGLKTSFYYFLKKHSIQSDTTTFSTPGVLELASSFQEAVFDSLLKKTEAAVKKTGIKRLIVGGGVAANLYLRKKLRQMMGQNDGSVLFPPYKYLTGDNAAMIGIVAGYKAEKKEFIKEFSQLDRIPRLDL